MVRGVKNGGWVKGLLAKRPLLECRAKVTFDYLENLTAKQNTKSDVRHSINKPIRSFHVLSWTNLIEDRGMSFTKQGHNADNSGGRRK